MLAGEPGSCCGSAKVHLKAAPPSGNDKISTDVTVTHVRRESSGALSSTTAVLLWGKKINTKRCASEGRD